LTHLAQLWQQYKKQEFDEKTENKYPFVTGDPDLLTERCRITNLVDDFDNDDIMVLKGVDNTHNMCPGSYKLKIKNKIKQFPHISVILISMNDRNKLSSTPIIFLHNNKQWGAIFGTTGSSHFTAARRENDGMATGRGK
jgi:hypothetical protein